MPKASHIQTRRVRSRDRMRRLRQDPATRQRLREQTSEWKRTLRYEVLSHYSGDQPSCARCGFSDLRALCLDHVGNDGAAHRKELLATQHRGASSGAFYVDVRRRHFPPGFQVLCHNCNHIKQVERDA